MLDATQVDIEQSLVNFRVPNGLRDTFDISEYILKFANVVTVPGDGFGAPGHIRFSYATNKDTIKEGIKRVKSALEKIY